MAVGSKAPSEPGSLLSSGPKRGRADKAFRWLALISGLLVLAILALIVISTSQKAWPAFSAEGINFITSRRWAPSADTYGTLAFIYGTIVISLIALIVAVPVSLGIALFLSILSPVRLRKPVSSLVDLLAAVPSVVFGLWGILVVAPWIDDLYLKISDATRSIPVLKTIFGGPVNGKSYFTAGLILAVMILPIITSLSREVLDTVPGSSKEAALALGATRWEMIRGAVMPYSKAGIIGAVGLGLGRAMGETIAVALVIGSQPQITARLFASGDAMPAVIANQFGEAGGIHRAALIGLGVELFLMVIIVNMLAKIIVVRGSRL